MHGRLKLKTTAQQEEEKRKEREQKLKIFRHANEQAFLKRENKEYHEVLGITGQILSANPDYYTLWNFRKEIFQHFETSGEGDFEKLFTNELHLTETCFMKNPKSYGAWHHRMWILLLMPTPDWKREVKLCNTLLQLDERNFHCWDHRRQICKLAETNPDEELKFTMSTLESNFSNYSAWHYRSSLLPLVYPGPHESKSIVEDKLLEEYELVQNAAFTDPTDQSAWFYHRWLLGRVEQRRQLLLLYVSRDKNMVYVVFSKPLKRDETKNIELIVNHINIPQHWETRETSATTIWGHKLPETLPDIINVQVVHHLNDTEDSLQCDVEGSAEKWVWSANVHDKLYRSEKSEATAQVLKQELESCQQLQELEPNNKWTILTVILLMRALNIHEYHTQVLEYLDQLERIDSMRRRYYRDMRSKFVVEHFLDGLDLNCRLIVIENQKLTILPHTDRLFLMQEVTLCNNSLTSAQPLRHLACVIRLNLGGNQLRNCSGLEKLQNLEFLCIQNNDIERCEDLLMLKECPRLHHLFPEGNPCYPEFVKNDVCLLVLKVSCAS